MSLIRPALCKKNLKYLLCFFYLISLSLLWSIWKCQPKASISCLKIVKLWSNLKGFWTVFGGGLIEFFELSNWKSLVRRECWMKSRTVVANITYVAILIFFAAHTWIHVDDSLKRRKRNQWSIKTSTSYANTLLFAGKIACFRLRTAE